MKVFVTVGSMLPFDRLVRAADAWAAEHPEAQVIAQIGKSALRPVAMTWREMYAPREFRECCDAADVIVSHLGMGTVLTAAELGKPLVALPRRPGFGEVTNDHQSATARWLGGRPGLTLIDDPSALGQALATLPAGVGLGDLEDGRRRRLVACVRAFVLDALTE